MSKETTTSTAVGAPPAHAPSSSATKDIVAVAIANGQFATLTAAVTAAGLVDTLTGIGPFTVFAPTDAAFAALPAGTVDGLLKDTGKLGRILKFHVVKGRLAASDLAAKADRSGRVHLSTLAGQDLLLQVTAKGIRVGPTDTIGVVIADVPASNGVIHAIDGVLMPRP